MLQQLISNKRSLSNVFAGLILLAMFLIALFSSIGAFGIPGDSGTVDEVAHIPSGYSYDKYGDFRLNPEHPPLAKAVAGIPLAFMDINGLKEDWSWDSINQWEAGWYLLYEAGNDPAKVLLWSRLPMMILMLVLGVFIYKWITKLYGRKIGLLALTLYAFYPDVIAHGRLVTTDVAAALGYVLTLYFFDKMLDKRNWRTILAVGVAFGIAQLLKFSAFLLFGILLILILIRAYLERDKGFGKQLLSYFKSYVLVCLISLVVVWIVYIPFVRNTPIPIEHEVIERNLTQDTRTLPLRNFLHSLEGNTITRAIGHYLLGVMLVIGRVEGGNATFLMGQVAEKSIGSFFPMAWILKTPLTVIILTLWSLALLAVKRTKDKKETWLVWLISTPIIVYWGFTLKGSLNIGIRHLLPTIPFVLLLIAYGINKIKNVRWQYAVVCTLILFQIIDVLSYYPSYIGYFNIFIPRNQRYNYLVDSSLDWGQDLLRLKQYVDNNNIKEIKVDYFGGSVPSYYIPQSREWHSSYGPAAGWLAVSATFYQSSKLYGPKEGKWSYEWLDNQKPQAIIGGSILVFNITQADLIANPPKSSHPITKLDFPKTGNVVNSIFKD